MLTLREFLGRAETKAVAMVTLLGGVLKLPLLAAAFSALWSTSGEAFAFLAIGAFTIAPRVAFLPETPLTIAALLVGGIVLLKRGREWIRSFLNRFRRQT
jgi:uncharacterized membrane protein